MKKLALLTFIVLVILSQNVFAGSKETANCIRNPKCGKTFIAAHRANGLGAPENSREAIKNALRAGVEIVEIDVRRSKDNYLYVIHDRILNRTTSQKGRVDQKLSIELENALLENGETLPMLQDIYDISRGEMVLNLDFKTNEVEQVAEWISRNGAFDDFIFFVDNIAEMISAADMKKKYPALIVMAREKPNITIEDIEKIFVGLPEIIHTDYPQEEWVSQIHELGRKIFANSLAAEKAPWPINSLLVSRLLNLEVDFIQTDEPKKLLREVKRRQRSLEKRYNFGVVYEGKLLRSRAPSKEFLQYLKDYRGLKTIVDLRNPNSANEGWRIKQEREWAEELGVKYINMPVISSSAEKYTKEIQTLLENNDGAILVHCQAGKDRTGAIAAFLRMRDGWTYEEARKEMKKYGHNPNRHERFHKHLRAFTNKMGVLGIDRE